MGTRKDDAMSILLVFEDLHWAGVGAFVTKDKACQSFHQGNLCRVLNDSLGISI
jgi:hypothetical protein